MSTLTLRLETYTKEARRIVAGAQALADERKNTEVEPVHLLYTLIGLAPDSKRAFERAGVDPSDVLLETEAQLRRLGRLEDAVAYLSPRMLDLLGRAEGEAAREGGASVSVQHLLVATAQDSSAAIREVLRACALSAPVLRSAVADAAMPSPPSNEPRSPVRPATTASGSALPGDALTEFGRDLTGLATQGRLDPVIGREAELRRLVEVLARRRENNPLLVGEPGVGKTAIVHGFASQLARGMVPSMLRGKRLVTLDTSALLAGARLRGELEERIRRLLAAVRDAGGETLLHIPDLAALALDPMRAGTADMIASSLGRGELRAIAVCSPDGLRRMTEDHGPLLRPFVAIVVNAPSTTETLAMLRGLSARLEADHGIRVDDPALVAAATFARRYVPTIQLPKAAVDLVDEAAARVRIRLESPPEALLALESRIETLELERRSLADAVDPASEATKLALEHELGAARPKAVDLRAAWESGLSRTAELRRLRAEIAAAKREEEQGKAVADTPRAAEIRSVVLPRLEQQTRALEGAPSSPEDPALADHVTAEDIASVVATWTGIPVAKMLEGEAQKLLEMEDRIGARVVGQREAVGAIARAVRRGRAGLRDPRRPIGSFLFLGPTGVGKTELAKALAEFLFDDESSLTRLDMSEFMEKHMVARLLGAPPGYVDSEAGGFLTESVRRKPYSVVLFDEVEKAHPDVFNILLQVLDDGRLTDSRGRVAHFGDTVIIMTSNIGGSAILAHEGTDDELRTYLDGELARAFRPELLNRIDDVIVFHRLSRVDLTRIADIQLATIRTLLKGRGIALTVSDAAKAHLVEVGYEPAFGARPLKRTLLKQLQDPLAEQILRDGYRVGDAVRVDYDGTSLTFARS